MVPADAKAWQVNPPPTQKEQGHTREQLKRVAAMAAFEWVGLLSTNILGISQICTIEIPFPP